MKRWTVVLKTGVVVSAEASEEYPEGQDPVAGFFACSELDGILRIGDAAFRTEEIAAVYRVLDERHEEIAAVYRVLDERHGRA